MLKTNQAVRLVYNPSYSIIMACGETMIEEDRRGWGGVVVES